MSGMVMNGPTPIMSIMLSAVALPSPIPRMRPGALADDSVGDPMRRSDYERNTTNQRHKQKNDRTKTRNRKPQTGNRQLTTGYCFALSKFTYSRTAPGTPAGSCRKNAYPV